MHTTLKVYIFTHDLMVLHVAYVLCPCRSDHLYLFFMHWSPETFGDGMGSISREPGFMVVKKIDEPEADSEQTTSDSSTKEWEVASVHQLSFLLTPSFKFALLLNNLILT